MKETCVDCLLKEYKEIPYRGLKHNDYTKCDVVVLMESPGNAELKKGYMLAGRSLEVVQEDLNHAQIDPNRIFLLNSSRCMIETDQLSNGQIGSILKSCRPNVEKAIQTIQPKLIICMGAIGIRQAYKSMSLKNARNNFFWSDEFNCWIVATYHPAACLRSPARRPYFRADLEKVSRFINNDFQHMDDATYKEVDSIRPILDGDCYSENGYYLTGVDTETQGLKWYDPNSVTICYQVSRSPYEGWIVILHEEVEKDQGDFNILVQRGGSQKNPHYEEIGVKKASNYDQKVAELDGLCRRTDIKKYFFNEKYEKHRFVNLGITEFNSFAMCARTCAHTINSELYKNCSLEDLTNQFLEVDDNHKGELTEAEKSDMLGLLKKNREKFNRYSGKDPARTLHVGLKLREKIIQDRKSLNYFVNFAQPVENDLLFEMERNGVLIDSSAIPKVKESLKKEIQEKQEEVKRLCPKKVVERHENNFKLTRSIIIKEALFEWTDGKLNKNQTKAEHHNYGFNLAPLEWSQKSGSPSIKKDTVMNMIVDGNYSKKVKNLVSAYLEWSERNHLLTHFLYNLERHIAPDGRIHPSTSITFSTSGRTGFREPNAQNQPKRGNLAKIIRQLFIAPDGFNLAEKDYKASELRWVAHEADEPKMKEIFKKGKDPHRIVGLWMRRLPEDYEFKDANEKKQTRQQAKPTSFGLIYLMEPKSLKNYAKMNYGVEMTMKQAEDFYNQFLFNLFRNIPKWHERCKKFLRKYGYLRTSYGRKRSLPDIYSDQESAQKRAERTGVNALIQGVSSDTTLLSGLTFIRDPRVDKSECRLVLFIHDALVFEIKEDKMDYYLSIIKEHMENPPTKTFGFTMEVPLETETEVGPRLSEMEEIDL